MFIIKEYRLSKKPLSHNGVSEKYMRRGLLSAGWQIAILLEELNKEKALQPLNIIIIGRGC